MADLEARVEMTKDSTKRLPLSRCASAIQIVRRLESTAETQPKLQPDFLRLSAMVSQYFMTVKWLGLEWPARDARNKLARNEAKRSKPMLE